MKKIYFVLVMNIFTQMATEIKRGVNRMESDINQGIDTVKSDIEVNYKNTTDGIGQAIEETLVDKNSDQFILIELRKDKPIHGFTPKDIFALTDQEALKFIAENKSKIKKKELIINEAGESIELSEEGKTQELLSDPQIADIYNDLRKDFPSPTSTPGPIPMYTPVPTITPGPGPGGTPSGPQNIEGFEDVPLSINEQVNRHLKQKFIDNFTF